MGKGTTPAIKLVFDTGVRSPGDVVEGEVELYFPALVADNIDEVILKLRGAIITSVTHNSSEHDSTARQQVDLIHKTESVWWKGSNTYPSPGSHTLRIPFRFVLPDILPPSCVVADVGRRWWGTVGYTVALVGKRPRLRLNRRVLSPFPVLPHHAQGAGIRSALNMPGGWSGDWTKIRRQNKIRRGLWGEYATVEGTLNIPALEVLPINTPIPFTLNVVTRSKTMKKEASDEKEDATIFPPLPSLKSDLDFRLMQVVNLKADAWSNTADRVFCGHLGGMAARKGPAFYEGVEVLRTAKVWIPLSEGHDEKKSRGQWKQEVTFTSSFTLTCPPGFETETLTVKYHAFLKANFPGLGNVLSFDFPLRVVSCTPPSGVEGWDGPPPDLDLPPSYFAAEGWFTEDEKNSDKD